MITEEQFNAGYDKYSNAAGAKEALEALSSTAGVDMETAVKNIADRAPEHVVRMALKGVLTGMLDAERYEAVLVTMEQMARYALRTAD